MRILICVDIEGVAGVVGADDPAALSAWLRGKDVLDLLDVDADALIPDLLPRLRRLIEQGYLVPTVGL